MLLNHKLSIPGTIEQNIRYFSSGMKVIAEHTSSLSQKVNICTRKKIVQIKQNWYQGNKYLLYNYSKRFKE